MPLRLHAGASAAGGAGGGDGGCLEAEPLTGHHSEGEPEIPPPAIRTTKSNPGLLRAPAGACARRHAAGLWLRHRAKALAAALSAAALAGVALWAAAGGTAPAPAAAAGGAGAPAGAVAWAPAAGVVFGVKELVESSACSFQRASSCTATSLFDDPEVHVVVADGLMRVGVGLLTPADEDMVRDSVAQSFRNASGWLRRHAPWTAAALQRLRVTLAQREEVLATLVLIAQPRVQSIGLDVARALRGSGGAATDTEFLKRHIQGKLRTRLADIRRIRDGLVPRSLLRTWVAGRRWEMTLAGENVRVMQTASGSLVTGYVPGSSVDLAKKSWGILGGALEEFRALVDAVKVATGHFESELDLPERWLAQMEGAIGEEVLACELVTMADNRVDFMKALFCPLKFGTLGLDALRAADEMEALLPGLDGPSSGPAAAPPRGALPRTGLGLAPFG